MYFVCCVKHAIRLLHSPHYYSLEGRVGVEMGCLEFYLSNAMFLDLKTCFVKMPALTFSLSYVLNVIHAFYVTPLYWYEL